VGKDNQIKFYKNISLANKKIKEVLQDKAQHKLVILQGVGHQGQYEAPEACFEAINAFI
jgi:pimeloyl-ACP methyl ester carboxylesterase